jgi:hypothetical protein
MDRTAESKRRTTIQPQSVRFPASMTKHFPLSWLPYSNTKGPCSHTYALESSS